VYRGCLALTGAMAVVWLATADANGQKPRQPAAIPPTVVSGQKPAPETKAWKVPRTSDGRPDLEGIWDYNVITPLERPKSMGTRAFLTDEEFAQREAAADKAIAEQPPDGSRAPDPRDADRPGAPAGEAAARNPMGVPYNRFWNERARATRQTSLIVDPPDGRMPPLTPEAEARNAAMAAARRGLDMDAPTRGGWVHDLGPRGLAVRCIVGFNSGPPVTNIGENQRFQVLQTRDHVVILNEMIHDARIVPLDGRPHLSQRIRHWLGDSRGRWEGDTLVVDTTNFTDMVADMRIGFRSGGTTTHLVERLTRTAPDTLLYEYTLTDPSTWTRPWTAQIPLRKSSGALFEYACHEGNYSLPLILSGARERERAEEEAAVKRELPR
jgi:hypothetical protein